MEQPQHNRLDTFVLLLAGSCLLLSLLIYVPIWRGVYSHPALEGVDFLIFYTAGTLVDSGQADQLYNIAAQHAVQQQIVAADFVPGGALPYNHPPFLVPLIALVIDTDTAYHTSYVRWSILLLAVVGIASVVGVRLLIPSPSPQPLSLDGRGASEHGSSGLSHLHAITIAASIVCFYPVFISLLKGQDTAFVLLGLLVWAWAMQRPDMSLLAGAGLALTTIRPHIALPLVLALLVSRHRAGLWFIVCIAGMMLASFVLIGWQGWIDFLLILMRTAEGQGLGIRQHEMFNLIGFALRLFPTINPALVRTASWLVYGLTCGVLCWLWWSRRERLSLRLIGLSVLVCLWAAPHLHFHDVSLMLLPVLALLAQWIVRGSWWKRVVPGMIAVWSMLLLVSGLMSSGWLALVVAGGMLAVGTGLYAR